MKITNVLWLDRFIEKIGRKHGVTEDEVEEVFAGEPRVKLLEKGDVSGENLYIAIGQTEAGRWLAIFFIYKGRNRALVISARDASSRERKGYGKRKK